MHYAVQMPLKLFIEYYVQARSHWLGWSGFNLTTFTAVQFMQY